MGGTYRKMGCALALGLATTMLSGCGGTEAAPTAAVDAGIAVTDGRMVLNAVSGNPAAIYFTLANTSDRVITLRGAAVANAQSAELHSYQEWGGQMVMGEMAPLSVKPGESVTFQPGGRHVMVMGVSPQLQAGGTTDVTLTLLGGATHSFPVNIVAAGSADETPPAATPPAG